MGPKGIVSHVSTSHRNFVMRDQIVKYEATRSVCHYLLIILLGTRKSLIYLSMKLRLPQLCSPMEPTMALWLTSFVALVGGAVYTAAVASKRPAKYVFSDPCLHALHASSLASHRHRRFWCSSTVSTSLAVLFG
jgi:hypothetical protein